MRSTLSCSWCRHSKVKCSQHHGDLPCRRCQRAGRTLQQCVLQALPKKSKSSASRPVAPNLNSASTQTVLTNTQARHPERSAQLPEDRSLSLANLTRVKLMEVLEVFQRAYPELCMVHLTDTVERWDASHDNVLDLKVNVIMALCAGSFDDTAAWAQFATSLRNELWPRMMQHPDIDMVQCLLLISQLEWSQGNGYTAWMHAGIAVRMFEGLEDLSQAQQATRSDHQTRPEARETIWRRETTRRTYWTCFIMERVLACSRSRPSTMAPPSPTIPLPSSEDDFELGVACESPVIYTPMMDGSTVASGRSPLTIHNHFEIVIRSLDIWSHTCRWISQGGRRQTSMRPTCPWEPTSPWNQLVVSLEGFRETLHPRMKFPDTPLSLYLLRRQGEKFAFINLIYYCTIIILYREYLPFVPEPFICMAGPTEPPLLSKQAPEEWWAHYTKTLFDASAQTTAILNELSETNLSILSPIVGYCAFTAASMNLYLAAFPWVDPASSREMDSGALSRSNIDYLRNFAQKCPIGRQWVQVAEQTRDFYRRTDPARTWSCNDYPVQLRKTLESYGSLSTSPTDNACAAGQPDYGARQVSTSTSPHNTHNVSSGEAVAVTAHQAPNIPVETAEDLLEVDWSNFGWQSLFPQDPGSMGNELPSDWCY